MAYSEARWTPAEPDRSKLFLGVTGDSPVQLDKSVLLKHVVALGASGSGKTWLCKSMVEEAIRQHVPVIAIDPQGDIASMGLTGNPEKMHENGLPAWLPAEYWNKVDFKVWTPGSEWGLPLSLQPMICLDSFPRTEDKIRAVHGISQEIASLAGFNDEATVAGFSKIIQYADRHNLAIDNINDILDFLKDPPAILVQELEPIFGKKDRSKVLKGLLVKMNGPRQLLMQMGMPIHIDTLLGYESGGSYERGKVRLSVISLQALTDMEERQIFIASLARQLYQWMLADPKPIPVAMLYMDEIAPYIPPVRKPICKDPLMLLLRQARKYGLSLMLATQSPGDIDYVGIGQIGTKIIGRMSTNQDAHKIAQLFSGEERHDFMEDLPSLNRGEFFLSCPDQYAAPIRLQARYLSTQHRTMTLEAISELVSDDDRIQFR